MGGAGGAQRKDMYRQPDMCPKGIIRNGNKDLQDAHPSTIYSSRGEIPISSVKEMFL